MPRAHLRSHRYVKVHSGLEKITGELIDGIAEVEDAPCDATPMDIQGFNYSTYDVS